MRKNSISDLMKEIRLNSPLKDLCRDKRLTNYTARKTVVKKLQSQGVQRSDIISITGHTTTGGLDAYDERDNGLQRVLSNMIDGTASSSNTSAQAPRSTCSMTMSRPNLLNRERRSPAVLQSGSLPETSLPLPGQFSFKTSHQIINICKEFLLFQQPGLRQVQLLAKGSFNSQVLQEGLLINRQVLQEGLLICKRLTYPTVMSQYQLQLN